jgi:membrane-associated phospholipid phosphatase
MIPWEKITFVGDSVVLLPLAFIIAAWLAVNGSRRLAVLWSGLLVAGLAIVVASKIAFLGWGIGSQSLDFTGFSGHAMRAAAVLPVLPFVMLPQASRHLRLGAMAVAIVLAMLIGISRIAVGAHSVSEVVGGALLGAVTGAVFLWLAKPDLPPVRHAWAIFVGLFAMLATARAEPAPTNRWMVGIALYVSGHDRPFDRSDWPARTCGRHGRIRPAQLAAAA